MRDRQTLWTEVEFNEHRKDAQLAYSLDIALQNELTMEENIELLDRFVTEEMVPIGMIVDVAIHNPDRGKHGIPNPHGHLSSPMRPFLESGEWGIKQHMEYVLDENGERIRKPNEKYKTIAVSETGWNDPALLEHWRERWAELVNQKFEEKGLTCRINHRSNEARGITDAPQVHEGIVAEFFHIVSIGYVLYMLTSCIQGYITGIGRPERAMLLLIAYYIIFRVLPALMLKHIFGLSGIWFAFLVSHILACVLAIVLLQISDKIFLKPVKKHMKKLYSGA